MRGSGVARWRGLDLLALKVGDDKGARSRVRGFLKGGLIDGDVELPNGVSALEVGHVLGDGAIDATAETVG